MGAYPAALTPDRDGGFTVSFRDVPEAITEGDMRDEALLRAEDALEIGARHVCWCQEAAANIVGGGDRRGHGASFGLGNGENRIVRANARARRRPCGTRASATLAPATSQSRTRPASRFADRACRGRTRRPRPAPRRRRSRDGIIGAVGQVSIAKPIANSRGRSDRDGFTTLNLSYELLRS